MRGRLGFDCWKLRMPHLRFLQEAKRQGFELYQIRLSHGDEIWFQAPVFQRRRIQRSFPDVQLLRTSGLLGMSLRALRDPIYLASIALSCALWFGLSQFVYTIEYRGDKQQTQKRLEQAVEEEYGRLPFYALQSEEMEQTLQEKGKGMVDWLEVEREGSRMTIRFTSKEQAKKEQLGRKELIAQRDGVIAGFDLQHGNKCVDLNDVVKKGDVLVSNHLQDTANKEEKLYVKGRVFAYTWEQITVEEPKGSLPQPFQFFRMLLAAREQVSADFLKDDRIEAENILQFGEKAGKIRMTIHYTVYRDISSPA